MRKILKNAVLAVVSLLPIIGFADNIAIGPRLSTTGIGIEVSAQFCELLKVRSSISKLSYSTNLKNSTIHYKGTIENIVAPILLDYHPFADGFRISGGIAYQGFKMRVVARETQDKTLFGHKYTAKEIGTTTGTFKFSNSIVPYLSMGYDSSVNVESGICFNAEIGMMYVGSPKFHVFTDSRFATEQLNKDLQRDAEIKVQKNING